ALAHWSLLGSPWSCGRRPWKGNHHKAAFAQELSVRVKLQSVVPRARKEHVIEGEDDLHLGQGIRKRYLRLIRSHRLRLLVHIDQSDLKGDCPSPVGQGNVDRQARVRIGEATWRSKPESRTEDEVLAADVIPVRL